MSFTHPSRLAALLAGYGALFLLFDTTATLFEVAPGVSTWYPSAGLNLALLIVLGARFAPVVFVASFLSGLLIANPPIPAHHLVLPNLVIAAGNAAAAEWLRRSFEPNVPFGLNAIGRFLIVAFGLPVVVSVFGVGAYVLTGLPGYTTTTLWEAVSSWWIADTVGILSITPICLLGARTFADTPVLGPASSEQLSFDLTSLRGIWTAVVDIAVVVLGIGAAFYLPTSGHFHFYVCFLPLLWIALRSGLPRTCAAILLINLSAAFTIRERGTTSDLLEFQFFMVALALTGLLLALLVSERRRSVHILQSATTRLKNRLVSVSLNTNAGQITPLRQVDEDLQEGETEPVAEPVAEPGHTRTGLWRMSDVLDSSSDVLSRSADNLVALNDLLLESRQRLDNLNAQKDKLLSLISHDLKNPLAGIRGLADVLKDDNPPDRFERPLSLIQRSAQQGLDLLDNLLTWSRLQTGHVSPDLQTHRLRTLAGEALAQLEAQASRKEVTVENSIQPGIVVRVDPFIVDTVLRNLVSNAIKFTGRGGYVSLTAYPSGDHIEVSVSDTGVGIPPERMASLFQIEEQTSMTGTEGEVGTGLGLHICRELVEAQGGTIWLDSTEGSGTTVYFTLPSPTPSVPDPSAPHVRSPIERNAGDSPAGDKPAGDAPDGDAPHAVSDTVS